MEGTIHWLGVLMAWVRERGCAILLPHGPEARPALRCTRLKIVPSQLDYSCYCLDQAQQRAYSWARTERSDAGQQGGVTPVGIRGTRRLSATEDTQARKQTVGMASCHRADLASDARSSGYYVASRW
jgi:hypothetical protein